MKTKRYIIPFLLAFIFLVANTAQVFGQKGRFYHGYPHGYSYARPHVSVNVGAYGYPAYPVYPAYPRCHSHYYPPHGAVINMAIPPFGMTVPALPYGYFNFYIGPNPYYYYNGIYYRPYSSGYQVIAPPLGAVVNHLPAGAKPKVIDGEKYYELNGTYYKENLDSQDRLSYKVVGTDGVLNTEKSEGVSNETDIGYKTDKLPPDSKSVVINGEKLYTTPSGLYYREITQEDKIFYELVGK